MTGAPFSRKAPPRRREGYGSRLSFAVGLALTLAIATFLILPAILSMLAGVTVNYFRGLSSGLTLRWVGEVLALYSDTLMLTLGLAMATLATTLVLGVPAAWYLVRNPSRTSRAIEAISAIVSEAAGPSARVWSWSFTHGTPACANSRAFATA